MITYTPTVTATFTFTFTPTVTPTPNLSIDGSLGVHGDGPVSFYNLNAAPDAIATMMPILDGRITLSGTPGPLAVTTPGGKAVVVSDLNIPGNLSIGGHISGWLSAADISSSNIVDGSGNNLVGNSGTGPTLGNALENTLINGLSVSFGMNPVRGVPTPAYADSAVNKSYSDALVPTAVATSNAFTVNVAATLTPLAANAVATEVVARQTACQVAVVTAVVTVAAGYVPLSGAEGVTMGNLKSNSATFNNSFITDGAFNGVYLNDGLNNQMGLVTLTSGAATIASTKVWSASRIFLTRQSLGGTTGTSVDVTSRIDDTSFNIASMGSTLDTSVVAWNIFNPPLFHMYSLSATTRIWYSMCTGLDGAVYACVDGGSIYKSTNGGVSFVDLSAASRRWFGMCTGLDGAVYASVYGGSIYKSTNGGVSFVDLSAASRGWYGMCTGLDGAVYVSVYGGSIYKSPWR
jgi:hypothetical protein